MLNYVLYLILYMLLLSVHSYTDILYDDLQKYLNNKELYVNNELTSIVRTERDSYKTFEFLSHRRNKLNNLTSLELVDLFNKSYAFDGSLYEIVPAEINFSTRSTDFLNFNSEHVKFMRTVRFDNSQFILVCLENGVSNVYRARNIDNIIFVHSIENPDLIKDSKFFVNDNKLYLITTSSVHSSTTIIYEWLQTYFDKMKEISMMGAVSMFTFAINKSEIIVLLQNSTAWKENSLIYEFRDNQLTKIQELRIINPYCMKKYTFNNHTFLIIFNKLRATLYEWNEMEMVYLADFPMSEGIEKIRISYVNNIPILFTMTKAEVISYSPTNDFRLLHNYTFERPFEKIYDMETIEYSDKHFLYFAGKTMNESMELNSIQFALYSTETDNKVYEKDRLTLCISDLQTKVNDDQRKLNHVSEIYSTKKQLFETSSALGRTNRPEKWLNNVDFMLENYNKSLGILNEINVTAASLFQRNTGIFDGRINLHGRLDVQISNAKTISVNKLNSIEWIPERWLSYATAQTLTGKVTMEAFKVENLWLPKGNLFENALLSNVNQRLYGKNKFESLESTDLYSNTINKIQLNNIFFKGNTLPIRGKKTFNILKTNILNMDYLNGKNASDILQHFSNYKQLKFHFGPTVNITNLEVETISDVEWNLFKDSVFRSGKTTSITGDFIINNQLKVARLNAKHINGIGTNDFLTKTTDQIVTTKMNFGTLNSNNLNCTYINGLNLKTDTITLFDENKTVTGPVTVDNAIILKDLIANIVAVKPKFQQIYRTVKIAGVVRIENLRFQSKLSLTVNGKGFNISDINNRFWLKHTDQIIPTHMRMSGGVTAPYLLTDSLNDIKMKQYMLTETVPERFATIYRFRNLSVIGDIIIDDEMEHIPNLLQVNDSCVKLFGSFEISGKKTFDGILIAKSVLTDYLDGVGVDQALTIDHQEISDLKQFESLIIKGNLTVKNSDIHYLNGVHLNSIYDRYSYANRDTHLKTLKMEKSTVGNLETTTLNGESLNKFILNADEVRGISELKRVKINGNVVIYNIANLTHLEGVNFNIVRDKVFGEPIMVDKVKFTGDVFIRNLHTRFVNNLNILDMRKVFLSRYYPNYLTAKHHFKRLATNILIADSINNVDMTCIIDTRTDEEQTLLLRNKLTLISTTFKNSLTGNLSCDINHTVKTIKDPSSKHWAAVKILKNATIAEKTSIIGSILEHAVVMGEINVITMPVTFKRVTAKDIHSEKHINNINIEEIYRDALMKHNQDELVTGTKIFNTLTAAGVTTHGDSKIPKVNGILIEEVDNNLLPVDKIFSTIIKGHKIFYKGFSTAKLKTKEISNLKPENLVNLYDLRPLPQASFDMLHVLHNFDIFNINSKNFTAFLDSRILKISRVKQIISGVYYFDNIYTARTSQIHTPTINGIKLVDVVFDVGVANINALKEFAEVVIIIGNVWANRTQGVNITEEYENSVFINKEAKIEGNIIFANVDQINNTSTKNINGIPIESIKAMILSETPKTKAKIVQVTIDRVNKIIHTNNFNVLARKFLYLDRFHEYPVAIPEVISTQAIQTQDHVMAHLLSREPGYICGLNASCGCLIQNTIHISPEYSIYPVANKIGQRVYSYEDDMTTIHVITDSASYSSECRSLNTSSLEHATINVINKTNGFSTVCKNEVMNGYVMDVHIFSFHSNIYIILCKMFNTKMITQEAKCLVIKLNIHQSNINVLQEIPATTFPNTHLIRTDGDIYLIVPNSFINIVVYAFDRHEEKFLYLREIKNFYCTSATSIVFERNNFLMLSQKNNHIAVWKYNHYHRNYYFYQNLILDSPTKSILSSNSGGDNGAFIYAITENGNFNIYKFEYVEGWKLISRGELRDIQILTSINLNNQTFLLGSSAGMISLLSLIQDGQN